MGFFIVAFTAAGHLRQQDATLQSPNKLSVLSTQL